MGSLAIRSVLTIACAVSVVACSLAARLVLAPESTRDRVVFVLSDWSESKPGRLDGIYVYRCIEAPAPFPGSGPARFPGQGELVWAAHTTKDAEAPRLGRIAYGESLPGLITSQEPAALEPGCYIAHAYARFPDMRAGLLVFRVSREGKVASDA